MEEYVFRQAMADHTLFYKRDGDDIALLVYVDDMIVTHSNPNEIEKF